MSGKYEDSLGLIVPESCKELGESVNNQIMKKRNLSESLIIPTKLPRFSNGEGKCVIEEGAAVDKDLYLITDIGNYDLTYKMHGFENHMSPDDHFQDIKRVVSAINGEADRITVIMPMLYESRQHRRNAGESLDCALALQELQNLNVKRIITYDVHDPSVQNALSPSTSFQSFYPTNTMMQEFIKNEDFDPDDVLFISPDNGAMGRAIYNANMFAADVGMFYKRRDVSKIVNGKNPVVAHEYLGKDIKGKTLVIVDDMISSGGSMLDVAEDLKNKGAGKIYMFASFSLFTDGIEDFNKYYEAGYFNSVYSTNLTYIDSEITKMPWYKPVDCSNHLTEVIDTLNRSKSVGHLKNGRQKILDMLDKKKKGIL